MPSKASEDISARRLRYFLEFEERFTDQELSNSRWIPHYLPHWTTPERSAAFYILTPGLMTLQIVASQLAWLPTDSLLRVSNIQTGSFSGISGSRRGQHRHRADLVVQTPQPILKLYTPSAPARVEATLRASPDPTCMLALWLVGFEEAQPEQSGEICIVELFGDRVRADELRQGAELNTGVKKHGDPTLKDELEKVVLPGFDACEWHTYAAEWDMEEVRCYVDNQLLKTVRQRINYPMQLMIDLFEFPASEEARAGGSFPKTGDIKEVLGYRMV